MSITIADTNLDITRVPLARPFGFKGGYFTEKWVCRSTLTSEAGNSVTGIGGMAILWSDPRVFRAHSEVGGNLLMGAMLEEALQAARGITFETPLDLQDQVFAQTHAFGQRVTGQADLRPTFTLNSLVSLDFAAWMLYAAERGFGDFDAMTPERFRPHLSHRHTQVASSPAISYQIPVGEIVGMVRAGYFVLKIKIGAPGGDEEMFEKDKARLAEIHAAVKDIEVPWGEKRRVLYYLDANGRYDNKALLKELLAHADGLGMTDRILVVEEPFSEQNDQSVGDLGVRVAADESLHDPADVQRRIELGYGCLALKPAGKTLSMTLRMLEEAATRGVPCLVADSACTPRLVDWNKNVAARLVPMPGLDMGLLEANGHQNYRDWDRLAAAHPLAPERRGLIRPTACSVSTNRFTHRVVASSPMVRSDRVARELLPQSSPARGAM